VPTSTNAARPASLNASQRRVLDLAPRVLAVARTYDIDPLLLHAIAHVESRHNAQARSAAGALGVLQVMPATARRFGVGDAAVELYDPAVNLEVGAAYLKSLQARFGNDLELVLAAYNAGENAVERHGRSVPPYAETRAYVRQVLAEYGVLRAAFARVERREPR
jgi:soluble lytic murein transglycosylase-like protein